MKTKVLEIRDEATFIPALAVDINPDSDAQRYLMRRVGYPCDGEPNIILTRLSGDGQASNDPYSWGGRTFPVAHTYIIEHWDELSDGDVVDVSFILGETDTQKVSERKMTISELKALKRYTHPDGYTCEFAPSVQRQCERVHSTLRVIVGLACVLLVSLALAFGIFVRLSHAL